MRRVPTFAPRNQRKNKRQRGIYGKGNFSDHAELLRAHDLVGVLVDGVVWAPATPSATRLLDVMCLGNLDGTGAGVEAFVPHLPADVREAQSGATGVVRIGPDEAFFMQHVLGALRIFAEDASEGDGEALSGGATESRAEAPERSRSPGPGDAPSTSASPIGEAGSSLTPASPTTLGRPLTPFGSSAALWRALSAVRPDFPLLYLAYHHLRGKGWIPRTGLQYGADYVAYHAHPGAAHSELAVSVIPLDPELGALAGRSRSLPRFYSVQIANRLAAQVSKRLLLLYISVPGGRRALASPACLHTAGVHERLIRRWVAESQRGV